MYFNYNVLVHFSLYFLVNLRDISGAQREENRTNQRHHAETDNRRQKWISELMEDARHTFVMDPAADAKCQKDFELYKLHLLNHSIWALRMQESSEWPSTGLYAGTTYSLGNWDECMRVSKYDVRGQYCLVGANFTVKERRRIENQLDWPDEGASVWNALKKYESMPWILNRQNLHWAMCIPKSCKPSDVALSLNGTLKPIFQQEGLDIEVRVEPDLCSTKTQVTKFSLGFYIVCGGMGIGLTVQLLSTWLDLVYSSPNEISDELSFNVRSVIKSFSFAHNWKRLIRPSTQSATVYALKVAFTATAIHGHRLVYTFGYPMFNFEKQELLVYSKDSIGITLRGTFLVDGFFIISAFLTYHHGFVRAKERGIIFVLHSIVMRWARMLPSFVLIMLLIINVIPYVSQGPFWNYRINTEVENCSESFWYIVFAVGNIIKPQKMCTHMSWYISADMQLTALGVLLLYVLSRKNIIGMLLISTIWLISSAVISIVVYLKKYHIQIPAYHSFLVDPRKNEEYSMFYGATYFRIPTYLLGYSAAMVAEKLKQRNYKTSNVHAGLLVGLFLFLKSFVLIYVVNFFDFVQPYDRTQQALHATFLRLLYFLPECCTLIMRITSDLAFLAKFLESHIFTVIGRLTYCTFIVNMTIQTYHAASFQVLMPTFSAIPGCWTLCGDIMISFFAAFFLHICVEAPAHNLAVIIMRLIFERKETNITDLKRTDKTFHLFTMNKSG